MTTNRKFSQGRPLMPPTQMITVVESGGGGTIDTAADTTLLTLAELVATHGPVIVIATLNLTVVTGGIIAFKLFRDGAEINIAHRYVEDYARAGSGLIYRSMHWVDEAPGASPIYSLRAIAAAANNRYENGSRLSAML